MVLAAEVDGAFRRCGAAASAARGVAARMCIGRQHVAPGGVGLCGVRIGGSASRSTRPGRRRGTARRVARRRDDGEDRLAAVVHHAFGQDRIVMDDGAAIVLAGDVAAVSTATTPGARAHGARSMGRSLPCATATRPSAACRVPASSGDVVDIGRCAADVQGGRFVGRDYADSTAPACGIAGARPG